jgi:flavin reductase (DIM6/NTAB) family NADH-FMN oxidoreductase RutF
LFNDRRRFEARPEGIPHVRSGLGEPIRRDARVSDRRLRHADSAAFRHAMGALSSGVAIVACGEGEERAGCTAISLTSLSLAPPTLIVCLARSSSTLARLREVGSFSISLLAARHQALAHRFSGHSGVHGPRRFDDAQWVALATGAPVLAEAIAAFDCLVEEVIERHSHAILLGAVVSLKEGADEPLLTRRRGGYATLV